MFIISLHFGALLALTPAAFSWSAVALCLFLHWLTASIGVCLGYHRYLTHRGFELPRWLAYTVVFIGTLACQHGPIKWVGQHRMHHMGSDTDNDPHNAARGFWWSHMGWLLHKHPRFDDPEYISTYTKDLNDDRFYRFLDKYFILVQVCFGLLLAALGGLPFVVWGVFLRLVLVYHSTWFVNSAGHMFGYKNFRLENDLSTNCWWVGLLAYGEGWHNNHHAFAKSARHGLRANEIDMTWMAICVLKWLGLATGVRVAELGERDAGGGAENGAVAAEPFFKGRMVKQAA